MKISEKAKKIYEDAIVIDGQLAIEKAIPWSFAEKWELIDRYAKAGFHAITLSIANEENITEETLEYLAKVRRHILKHPDKYILAKSGDDILRAKKEKKLALRLMFQGTGPIGKNLELLEIFHELGITSMILAYNIQTPLGDGVIEEHDRGLSHLGKKWVTEMNKLGIIIDGSHGGYQSTMDALQLTKSPMVFSHSGAYGVHPHIRNMRDEQIKAVAATEGVIGINGIGVLLGDKNASIEKFVEHIDYIANLVGTKYIALGLDNLYFADQFAEFMQNQQITHPTSYAEKAGNREDWNCLQPEDVISVVELLIQRGYSEKDVKDILGANILRLLS